jgi:hypothetical protein
LPITTATREIREGGDSDPILPGCCRSGKAIIDTRDRAASDGRYARTCVARYQVGAPVAVYYDPKEPTTAVREPGISKKSFITLAFGLGIAFFGGWFCLPTWLFDG